MPAYVKVSGAWKQATTAPACYVKVSGAWKKCNQVYVKVNGAWKPCYQTEKAVTYKCRSPLPTNGLSYAYNSDFRTDFVNLNLKVGSQIIITGEWRNQDNSPGWHNFLYIGMTGVRPESSYGTPSSSSMPNWGDIAPEKTYIYPANGLPYDNGFSATYSDFKITLKVTKSPASFYLLPLIWMDIIHCVVQYTELI